MKNIPQQKELLLLVHSNFFSQQLEKVSVTANDGWFSQKEQLKDACRNGLVHEILPECFDNNTVNSIPLQKINDANLFINLQFSSGRSKKEKRHSINPYFFMQLQEFN